VNPRYRETARRHRVLFGLIILLCALFGMSSALGSPKLYRSSASLSFQTLDTTAGQFGTPPAAQNQEMLNELLATRNFPQRVAAESSLGKYLQTHDTTGNGPLALLKRVLKGRPTYDERIAAALGPKRVTSMPSGSNLLEVDLEAPTPALARQTLRALVDEFLRERKSLQTSALTAATAQFTKAKVQLDTARTQLNSYTRLNPGSTTNGDPEMSALINAQLQATRQLRTATSALNQAFLGLNGGNGLPTDARVFDAPNLPVGPTTGKKRVLELTIVGGFVGALISFGLIVLLSRSREDALPVTGPVELRQASPNGLAGAPEHEPAREAVGGEAGSGEQIRRE
jgi:hypothetical protein